MDDEACECGFGAASVRRDEVGARVRAAAGAIAQRLRDRPDRACRRPSESRWSMVEYGAHVRDVLLTIRDRLVIGLVEDDPGFKPLYRDERLSLGLYAGDTAEPVAAELEAAAAMFARLFGAIDEALLDRPVQYGYPDPQPVTLRWMGEQAVHEAEHHLGDVDADLGLLP